MNILTVLRGLLRLTGLLAEWARNRSLIKAGESKAVNKGLIDAYNAIETARRARDNIDTKRLRDKFKRTPSDS
tara:strand:+ start:241 stop:459 length:219 start_codon:yes stop_codon:yes gene_type:complete